MRIGFDNAKYLEMQSNRIRERIAKLGGKLYLEFGGKLFDDYHASRVLPGFAPDAKLQMLLQLKEQAEIVLVISAEDIDSGKIRGDLGISYDKDVLRLVKEFRNIGLYVGSVAITKFAWQESALRFEKKLEEVGLKAYHLFKIPDYPANVAGIVSDEGYGRNDYIETERPLVVITAPGPGSGKMATCLSQLYHEHRRGVKAGYAKFETFPIWNLPLKHPVNLAYEAATADLMDVNMIDPFHLETYGETTVNYNRDIEIFPVVNTMMKMIMGESPYHSPTDMGVNMAGYCICDDEACCEASRQEIIRRYLKCLAEKRRTGNSRDDLYKLELLMSQAGVTPEDRLVLKTARNRAAECGEASMALELPDGRIVTGRDGSLMGACAAVLMNAIKELSELPDEEKLLPTDAIEPIQQLKTMYLGEKDPHLRADEILTALSSSASRNLNAKKALEALPLLRNCEAHVTCPLTPGDERICRHLGLHLTWDA